MLHIIIFLVFLSTVCGNRDYTESYDAQTGHLILFIFFGLGMGAITTHILSSLSVRLPYTVVVFILGLLLAGLIQAVNIGKFGASIYAWKDIDAELMMYIFLPPLIFGEAMTLNWHHVIGTFWQCSILAGPGVLLGATLTGLVVMYVFPFSWSWTFCMVFGAVTSATDPVAVVSILKDSGASPNLTMIIIGESLLNDGTAMVLFGLFFGMLKGTTYSGGEVAIYFLKMVIGSPLVGIVCGLVGVYLLGRANRPLSSDDVTMQIAIALCTAYTVFVMGQETLGLSGVLTCYSAGLVFAWLSPALILQREAMHIVWGMVEWMANTLVFLLAGLIIGTETMHHIDLKNCGYLVLLYFTLMAIRFVVVFALFPFIRRAGQQSCTAREAVLISWSGLRGALSIALAMMVRSEVNDGDGAHPNELFFYVGGLAALTLLVNATSVAPLLSKLEILQREGSPHKSMIMLSITRNLRRHMRINLAELISKTPVADTAAVIDCNSLLSDAEREVEVVLQNSSSHAERVHRQVDDFLSRDPRSSTQEDTMQYVRIVFLSTVRTEYWASIAAGRLPRGALYTSALLYSVDKAMDMVGEPGLRDWECLCAQMAPSKNAVTVLGAMERCVGWSLRESYLRQVDEQRVYLLTNFIDAHERAQVKIGSFMGQAEGESSLSLPEEVAVIELSLQSVHRARQVLASIDPELMRLVSTRQVARSLLKMQSDVVEKMVLEGLLSHHDASGFLTSVSRDTQRVEQSLKAGGAVSSGRGSVFNLGTNDVFASWCASSSPALSITGGPSGNGGSEECGEYFSGDIESCRRRGMQGSIIGESLMGRLGGAKKKKGRNGGEKYVALDAS